MFKKILLPIDLQKTLLTEQAIKITIEEATKHGAEVYVLTVFPGFGMPVVASFFPDSAMKQAVQEVAKELKKFVREHLPEEITCRPILAEGNPPEQIVAQANLVGADLIIIPSHARGLERALLGSCALKVVEMARCSVMVVKG